MEETKTSSQIKETPFYKYHIEAGAKMIPFAGYMMPIQYTGITAEHQAVRENVGLFDLSHMGEFEISGPGALGFLQKMTTNDVSTIKLGQIQYTCMCYENGGIVDDLLIYHLGDRYMLVVNASNIEKDFEWLQSHLNSDVKLKDLSDKYGLLAVQGPNSQKVMESISSYDFESMPYYNSAVTEIGGHSVLFSRTGYTGEDGFEIYIHPDACDDIWEKIVEAGNKSDMLFIGLGARDSLRMEMKMTLYGNDIDQTTTPVEASLSWIVKLDKGSFVGSDIIKKQKKEKPKKRLICLELEGRAFPRPGYDLISEDQVVGKVTSGTFSPSLNKPIALGYLPLRLTKIGNTVNVKIRNKLFPAHVVKPPFYKEGTHR